MKNLLLTFLLTIFVSACGDTVNIVNAPEEEHFFELYNMTSYEVVRDSINVSDFPAKLRWSANSEAVGIDIIFNNSGRGLGKFGPVGEFIFQNLLPGRYEFKMWRLPNDTPERLGNFFITVYEK